jgi:hypothetical protein
MDKTELFATRRRTTRRLCSELLANPVLSELPVPLWAMLPLLPDHGPQTMAYPLIQLLQQ